jgi:hypothetical protein
MLFLPSSVWKGEPARGSEMKVVVREPDPAPPPVAMPGVARQHKRTRSSKARTARKRETPGFRRGA